jgi:CRP-like cAMP-binding protein
MKLTVQEQNWLLDALRKQHFFSVCSIAEIKEIINLVTKKHYDTGVTVVKQGTAGDFFFLIGQGKVSVYLEKEKKEKLSELGIGDYFGEISLITGHEHNASVITEEPCELFLIYRNDFIGLITHNPSLEIKILQEVEKRLNERKLFMTDHQKQTVFDRLKKIL